MSRYNGEHDKGTWRQRVASSARRLALQPRLFSPRTGGWSPLSTPAPSRQCFLPVHDRMMAHGPLHILIATSAFRGRRGFTDIEDPGFSWTILKGLYKREAGTERGGDLRIWGREDNMMPRTEDSPLSLGRLRWIPPEPPGGAAGLTP